MSGERSKKLTQEELAAVPSAVPSAAPRGDAADLGAPRRGEDLEQIVARVERLRDTALQEDAEVPEWHAAEKTAAIYAQALQQQETAERIRRTQRDAPRRNEEGERLPREKVPRIPKMVVPRAVLWDQTTIRDPETGASLVQPGMVGRWVRVDEITQLGAVRRSASRLHNYLAWGAEVVRDSAGEIVSSIYGVAVQGPPEVFAARSAKAAPTGTLNRDDLLAGTQDAIASFNRKVGEQAARLVPEADHGAKKSTDGEDTYARRGE